MKQTLLLVLCAAAAAAACSEEPSAPRTFAGTYDLESFGGVALPLAYPAYESVADDGSTVMCTDTLFSQTIHLRDDRTASLVTNLRSWCGGTARPAVDPSMGGTYTARADSVTLSFKAATPHGVLSWDWAGRRNGDALVFAQPAYTELDPAGTRLTWVFRRR